MSSANTEAIRAWDGVLFDKFARFRELLTSGLSVHGSEALRRHPPRAGSRVLDLGCGFGDTTLELARLVGGGAGGRTTAGRAPPSSPCARSFRRWSTGTSPRVVPAPSRCPAPTP